MSSYKSIDKRLITEGEKVNFTIYSKDESHTQMSLFLQSDSVVDGDDKVHLRELEHLYVNEEEYEEYKRYAQEHIQSIALRDDINFEDKASIVYEKASEVMDELFANPEALGHIESTKAVVNGFVDIVLHNEATVESIMKVAAHDYYTHTHSINVSIYSLSLAKFLGLEGKRLEDLGMSSMIHDLGKSKVSWEIINKNGSLTDREYAVMKNHPATGYDIAVNLGVENKAILAGIRSHHEKLDGNGYPDGLKDEQITLFPRIIAVCDVFDALTTKRSYKAAMTSFEAIMIMKKQMQGHLDMRLVDSLIKMISSGG